MIWHQFLEPIGAGIAFFLVAAVLTMVPFLLWRRHTGEPVPVRSVVGWGSFGLYLCCAWALVLLPLPDPSSLTSPAPINLDLLNGWRGAVATWHELGGLRAQLHNVPLVFGAFNIVLTLPLGVYGRRWFGQGFGVTVLAGFTLSLAFELSQLTAIWGLFPIRYRVFDVDDLLANTIGAALGWVVAPLVVLLPTPHGASAPPPPGRATLPRRALAVLLDAVFWGLITVPLAALAAMVAPDSFSAEAVWLVSGVVGFAMVFVVFPRWAQGGSPGKALLGLAVRRSGRRAAGHRLVVREAVVYVAALTAVILADEYDQLYPDRPARVELIAVVIPLLWGAVLWVIAANRSDRRSLPDLIAGTCLDRAEAGPPSGP